MDFKNSVVVWWILVKSKVDKKTVLMGVGNLLLKDEGIGVHVIQEMQKLDMPQNIELIDGGTGGLDIIYLVGDAERLIVVDAVDSGSEPGTIFKLNPEDVNSTPGENQMSLHQVGLLEVLAMVKQMTDCKEIIIVGVQPKEIDWGMELTPELEEKVPEIIDVVLKETYNQSYQGD